MNKITTCLPINDNDGNSVMTAVNAVAVVFSDIAARLTSLQGHGVWRNDAGVVFREPVLVLTAVLPEATDLSLARAIVEAALLRFKLEAQQESVVMAINDQEVTGDVEDLLAAHGGCTQLSTDEEGNESTRAFSFVDPIFF